jgi:hypothetical protein
MHEHGSFFQSLRKMGPYNAKEDRFYSGTGFSITISSQMSLAMTQINKQCKRDSSLSLCLSPLPSLPTSDVRRVSLLSLFRFRNSERKYTNHTVSSANHRQSQALKIGLADPIASSAPFDLASEQSTLGSKADNGSSAEKSSSTLSLTSTLKFAPPLTPAGLQHFDYNSTVLKAGGELMSATLAAARDISPFKGSVWEPEDDEWSEVDA